MCSVLKANWYKGLGKENSAFPVMKRGKVKQQLKIALALTISGVLALDSSRALAQSNIVPDGTLGNERSTVIQNFQGFPVEEITGGATRGANLFHSFQEFNVSAGRGAYFFSPNATIQNILARVTGNNPSQILGTLGTFGNSNPNLFLINPNGIIFGQNARLDVGGSFVATTANAIKFGNQGIFSASTPNQPSLLTVNPSAFLFNQIAAKPIINRSLGGLQVSEGQSLLLLGGEVRLDGGVLVAPGGRVELGAVAGTGEVGLNVDGNNLHLNFPGNLARADIALTNRAGIGVLAGDGGNINITARNLEISKNSLVIAGIEAGSGSAGAQAGDVTFNATGAITVAQSGIYNILQSGAVGNGGNINIKSESLSLDNTELAAFTAGLGNAGNVLVQANSSVSLTNSSTIFNTVDFGAEGNSGGINIIAGSVFFTGGGELQASTSGQGNAGNVSIQARDLISFDGVDNDGLSSGIFSTVMPTGVGRAGDIQLTARSLSLTNGAEVLSNTRGLGNAGNVTVLSDSIFIDGVGSSNQENSGIYTTVAAGVGKGGDINIKTGALYLTNGGELNTSTYAQGDSGNLTITANSILIDGVGSNGFTSQAGTAVGFDAIGKGGDLKVTTGLLLLTNGGNLDASTFGQGDAGNIYIDADSIILSGVHSTGLASGLLTFADAGANGKGGDIRVTTNTMVVQNGAVVNAETLTSGEGGSIFINARTFEAINGGQVVTSTGSEGKAGNITIHASDRITLSGSDPTYFDRVAQFGANVVINVSPTSGLFASTSETSTGQGGELRVSTGKLLVQDGAQITASSQGAGDAGNIEVIASSIELNNQAKLTTETRSRNGGNILLQVQDLLLMRHGSQISTSAGTAGAGGDGGNITINAPFVVAVPKENSDISANAFTGRGGNIQITAQAIFGTQFRPQDTPLSDITASSQFGIQGTVQINTLDVDPSRGLASLPAEVVDASNQIVQNCRSSRAQGGEVNKFIITGRGGLPPSPDGSLQNEEVITHWVTVDSDINKKDNTAPESVTPSRSSPTQLVEAQGWMIDSQGQIVLTASSPTVTPQGEWLESANCNTPQKPSLDISPKNLPALPLALF